jgi:hypothetical protein
LVPIWQEVPMLTLYGDLDSGNVYKVRLLLAHLGIAYRRVDTTQNRGETATAEFRAINPIGKDDRVRRRTDAVGIGRDPLFPCPRYRALPGRRLGSSDRRSRCRLGFHGRVTRDMRRVVRISGTVVILHWVESTRRVHRHHAMFQMVDD